MPVHRICRFLVFVAAGVILLLSLLPSLPEPPGGVSFADKIGHFAAYLGLGFLLARSGWAGDSRRDALLALAVALVFGGAIEWLQRWTGRQPELLDLLADGLGAAAGGLVAILLGADRAGAAPVEPKAPPAENLPEK